MQFLAAFTLCLAGAAAYASDQIYKVKANETVVI